MSSCCTSSTILNNKYSGATKGGGGGLEGAQAPPSLSWGSPAIPSDPMTFCTGVRDGGVIKDVMYMYDVSNFFSSSLKLRKKIKKSL